MFHGIGPFGMVVLIVAIVTFGRIYAARHGIKYRGKRGDWEPARTNREENERMRAEIAQLKERIATLERIAVDRRQRLADEIDALDNK